MRTWPGYFGEEPPSLRTFRTHLGKLEEAGCILKSPGDWLPSFRSPEHPERRPRYPQTLHVLESDLLAEWLATVGRDLLAANPDVECNPDRWRLVFKGWRRRARAEAHAVARRLNAPDVRQALLPGFEAAESANRGRKWRNPVMFRVPGTSGGADLPAAELAQAAHYNRGAPGLLLGRLDELGVEIRGRPRLRAQAQPERLAGAVALLAIAARRKDLIRRPAGWLVRTLERVPDEELLEALARTAAPEWLGAGPRRSDNSRDNSRPEKPRRSSPKSAASLLSGLFDNPPAQSAE